MKNLREKLANATIADLCLLASAEYKDNPAFSMLKEGEITRKVTYKQMGSRSRQLASALRQLGIETGDRVLLFSDNCPEWPISYFGIALAGAVSVPLLTGFSAEQIQHISEHSGVSAICLNKDSEEKFAEIAKLPMFSKLPFIYIDTMLEDENANLNMTISQNGEKKQIQVNPCNESKDYALRSPDDMATIIYTSGTQGNSKGVMLSSRNILASSLSSLAYITTTTKDKFLSVLPLAHSYECSLGFLAPVFGGSSITYLDRPPAPSVLLPALNVVRPTAMISVPLLIEKVYKNALAPKLSKNKLYNFPLTRPLAARIAGKKLIKALGGKLKFFGVGGAPLNPEVENFLYKARFPFAVGYGLTEAAPLVAGNKPLNFVLGSGLSAPAGVQLKIDNGEILVKGPNVMLGYYNDKEKTDEVITSDGWLRTGDIGGINAKDRLFIRGRLKALILGPSGENIYPEEIEGLLGSNQIVEEALVYLGKMGELIAMVRINEAAKIATDLIDQTLEELRVWVNKKLAAFSRLSKIEIRYEPFEKTPTMKIKRYLYV